MLLYTILNHIYFFYGEKEKIKIKLLLRKKAVIYIVIFEQLSIKMLLFSNERKKNIKYRILNLLNIHNYVITQMVFYPFSVLALG